MSKAIIENTIIYPRCFNSIEIISGPQLPWLGLGTSSGTSIAIAHNYTVTIVLRFHYHIINFSPTSGESHRPKHFMSFVTKHFSLTPLIHLKTRSTQNSEQLSKPIKSSVASNLIPLRSVLFCYQLDHEWYIRLSKQTNHLLDKKSKQKWHRLVLFVFSFYF